MTLLMTEQPRIVLHLDMDAFYAAVEVRENPALAGKPLIIGHRGRRGVVSTCSYEARKFGVHSAMPSVTAERLCPDAVWLSGRISLYSQVSRGIRRILDDVSPAIEPISIDEAFIDLTGIVSTLDAGAAIARDLKARVLLEERLTCSVGVSPNKFLAKVASDMDKPDGLVILSSRQVPEKLWPLPVRRLWGVGPKTGERLESAGIHTIGDILTLSEPTLATLVGVGSAAHLRRLARGEDDRPVVTNRKAKSISEERTYAEDLTRAEDIDRALLARAEGVARQLRRSGLVGRTVRIKVRTSRFKTWTRSHTLAEPTDLTEPILAAARDLFRQRIQLHGEGIRLLGLGIAGLVPADRIQPSLFVPSEELRAKRLAQATDAVRDRMGDSSIVRARLLKRPRDSSVD